MKNLFLAGLLLAVASLAGCATGGGRASLSQQNTGGAIQVGDQRYAWTSMVSVGDGSVKAYSVCIDPIPRTKNCVGGVVINDGYCILRCGTFFIPVNCLKDPVCYTGSPLGHAEPSLVASIANAFKFNFSIGGGINVSQSQSQSSFNKNENNNKINVVGGGGGGGPCPYGGGGCPH